MTTVDHLLSQRVTVTVRTQTGAEDDYGNPTWEETESMEWWHIQPRSSDEIADRPAGRLTHTGYAPADTVATHKAKIALGDQEFEVDGPPRQWINPRTTTAHHCEVDLIGFVE